MGTVVLDKKGLHIKRFYGGDRRGVCYQITIERSHVQIRQGEFLAMLTAFLKNEIDYVAESLQRGVNNG